VSKSHNSLRIHEYGETAYGQLLKCHLYEGVKDKSKTMDEEGEDREGDRCSVTHQ